MTTKDLPELPEPDAHMYPSDLEKFKTRETWAQAFSVAVGNPDERSEPLFTEAAMNAHAAAAYDLGARSTAAQPVEQTEMRLVPTVPTDEMLNAAKAEVHKNNGARDKALRIYRAMLAAAPPAASGDSTPASEPVYHLSGAEQGALNRALKRSVKFLDEGDPSGAPRAEPEAVDECCPMCNDGDGLCIYPYYGTAPHTHGTSQGWIGSTRLKPREDWGTNFREDPEYPGLGVYMRCPACGRGEPPQGASGERGD